MTPTWRNSFVAFSLNEIETRNSSEIAQVAGGGGGGQSGPLDSLEVQKCQNFLFVTKF